MNANPPDRQPLRIVVGVESAREARGVLTHAADLARRLGAHLHVVHAVFVEIPASGLAGAPIAVDGSAGELATLEAQECADAAAEILDALAPSAWSFHAVEGNGAGVLLEVADRLDAYCVVVGSRGEGIGAFLERLVHPSVSHTVIGNSPRPVFVVSRKLDG
jgi:nucleotide-binding universal stress UspA family protein